MTFPFPWRKDPQKRAAASKKLQVLQEQVASSTMTADDMHKRDMRSAVSEGIPVIWQDAHTGRTKQGAPVRLAQPTAAEFQRFSKQRGDMCAQCKHFNVEHGRKEILRQRFLERLVLEEEWALKHIGDPLHIGICVRSNGSLATGSNSPACGQFDQR